MKVLLAPTTPGWAFDHRAKDLLAMTWKGINFDLKYLRKITRKDQFIYDLIYPMTLEGAMILHKEMNIPLHKLAAGVTSERSIKQFMTAQKQFTPEFHKFLTQLRGINTASNYIADMFKPHYNIYKTRVGINEALFKPGHNYKKNGRFKVGWVGRIDKPEHRKLKGYDIVLAALKRLDADLEVRTFKEHYVPRSRMIRFYQELDCFVCSSQSEHIPLPILEAASCGVPIVSTKVGIVPELIKHRHNGLIVNRSPEDIQKNVQYLMDQPMLRQKIRTRIRRAITSNWTREKCQKDWDMFFKSI